MENIKCIVCGEIIKYDYIGICEKCQLEINKENEKRD